MTESRPPERKLRRMQRIRIKPQRSIEPRSARDMRVQNRKLTRRS